MSVGGEFGRRVSDDELCAEVRQAVEGGDEDALRRLGFGGFGGYAQRLSELMSDSVREGHDPQAEDFAAIMEEVARPAHYAHHLVNEAGTAVQLAKDEPLGIHMKPIETDFDDEAFRSTVGNAASKDDPTETAGALADGLGYFVKKLGNDFIKANAEAHSRAGFEVKVKRSGSTKCCPWCAARIGSWAIANAPDGVFGCHENCSCTVEYTSSTGAKTSARGANLHRYGAGAFVEVEYQPPHVGAVQGAEKAPHRLTGGANGGIINQRPLTNANDDYNKALNSKYSKGSDVAKAVYDKYVPKGGAVTSYNSPKAYHSTKNHKVYLDMNKDLNNPRRAGTTWFHEHGHYIDRDAGDISHNDGFLRAIKADVKAYENKIKSNFRLADLSDARIVIGTEFRSLGDISHSVQDIYGGVIGKPYPNAAYAHMQKYWKSHGRYGVCSEAFAHMFEASFDPDKTELMKQYLPNAWAEFEKLLGGLA